MKKNLTLEHLTAGPGEKVSGYMSIINADMKVPVTLICGREEGPTVLVTGGIHNAEYVGIQAAMELSQEMDAAALHGNVIILPLVNRSGFEHRTMSLVYEDGKNINREFPGNPDGTLTERICHTMAEKLFLLADYYVDLHSGDGYEDLTPHVYTQGAASPEVKKASDAMARAVNVPYRYPSVNASGGSYNHAGSMGVPGILLERGCKSLWSREEVDADKEDIYNVLRHLKVLEGPSKEYDNAQRKLQGGYFLDAEHTGLWYPSYRAGDKFPKGALLGTIKDYFGNVLEECYAQVNGVVLYQTASLNVLKGGPMIAYSEISE